MKPARHRMVVHVPNQTLTLFDSDGRVLMETRVATARNGIGERNGSECTPCGRHIVRAKIGAGQPLNAVFVSRRPTGEIYRPELRTAHPDRDWILTRILWLSGTEPGRNRLGETDTMRRFIYIHGCPDDDPMGVPSSRGCVKMRNRDIVALFDLIEPGTPVDIVGTG
ncbi:MAG: L,D-transpeptidase [Gammaproteobacteria bacterium]|nr:L,D-transpeptidase [Gammaproteobacteria bacterium]